MSETKAILIGAELKEVGSHALICGLNSIVNSASALVFLPIFTDFLARWWDYLWV